MPAMVGNDLNIFNLFTLNKILPFIFLQIKNRDIINGFSLHVPASVDYQVMVDNYCAMTVSLRGQVSAKKRLSHSQIIILQDFQLFPSQIFILNQVQNMNVIEAFAIIIFVEMKKSQNKKKIEIFIIYDSCSVSFLMIPPNKYNFLLYILAVCP